MSELLSKIRNNWKKAAILVSLFFAVFVILFYISNLDLRNTQEKSVEISPETAQKIDNKLKEKIGSTDVSHLNYVEWAQVHGLTLADSNFDKDPDNDGLPNYLEYLHWTDPMEKDSDKDNFTDRQEITNGYDPDAPGDAKPFVEISIKKLGVTAPMIWSPNAAEESLQKDLQYGVIHYPKTASPGQPGNLVISGHSSNYFWVVGDFNYIFENLNDLEAGGEVRLKTIQRNGRVIIYHYRVTDKRVTSPDDEYIFAETPEPTLTLSTCWPLGTNLKRLIVKAELIK